MLTEINVGVFKTPPPSQDHLLWEWQLLWRGSLQRGEFHKAVQFIQFPLPGLYHLKTWRNKLFTHVSLFVLGLFPLFVVFRITFQQYYTVPNGVPFQC